MLLLFKHPDSCYRRYCDYKNGIATANALFEEHRAKFSKSYKIGKYQWCKSFRNWYLQQLHSSARIGRMVNWGGGGMGLSVGVEGPGRVLALIQMQALEPIQMQRIVH